MQLSDLGEFGLIHKFSRLLSKPKNVLLGIGDDAAAILPLSKHHLILLTCDPVIEGIHFDKTAAPYQIGWKAMTRNLSDIAAMGGIPRYALVAASLPPHISVLCAIEIYRGLKAAAQKFGAIIVGGDTSHNLYGIHVTVTIVGEVARSELVSRANARVDDILYVTGTLGGSRYGKHLKFKPRIHEGRFLAQHFHPSAMIDVSDGLASDLQRLVQQSGVGFEIWSDSLPISSTLLSRKLSPKQQFQHAIEDGEDYELLFTVSSKHRTSLEMAWKKCFRLPLTQIGMVRPKRFGIRFIGKMGIHKIPSSAKVPNDHFRI